MSRKAKARKQEVAVKAEYPQLPQRERGEPVARALPQQWRRWLVPVLIALVTFAAFVPTLENQFVNWDDDKNLIDNPHYRGLGWSHLHWMWTTFHMGHYIPLTWMTLGLDYVLWGMQPLGYHLTSLLLHAANAVLFYFVALRILGMALPGPVERGRTGLAVSATFAALLFALHPLRVENVAWATERRDVLSGLFYLLTVLAYLRASARVERGRWWYVGSLALFICALLSKSMAVSLPVVLLILDVYPLRCLGGAGGWWGEAARRVYLEKIPFVLPAGATSALAFLAQAPLHHMASLDQLSVPGRLAVSAYGLSFYLGKTVAPFNLSPLYVLPANVNPWATPFLLSYGVVLAVTTLAWAVRRRVPGLAAAWLAYVVILLPVIGILQNGPQIAADRYTYQAGLSWALLAGAALLYGWPRLPSLLTGAAVCVLFGLAALTGQQVEVWRDSQTLWAHALAIDPNSSMAETNLGTALAQQGKPAEAIEHYQQALRITPDDARAHYNWGVALAQQGKPAEAIEHYQQALRLKPDHADAHNNWGLALAQQGKPAEAIEHYRQALRLEADHAAAHNNWGLALAQQGKPAEAIEHYRQALEIKPDFADAFNNWGGALARQGKLAEAIEHYQQALRIIPGDARAHYNWALALAHQDKPAEAIKHYQQVLRLKPDHADAHYRWGAALARQGKLAEAVEHYQQALRLKPDHADAHYDLGLALIQQGKMLEAIDHFAQATNIKPQESGAQFDLLDALRRRGMGEGADAPSRKGERAE